MLQALKRVLGKDQQEPEMDNKVEDALASVEALAQPDLSAQLSQALEKITAQDGLINELKSKLEQYSSIAQQAEAEAEALRIEAEQKAIQAKREKLADVLGKDNPEFESVFAATSALPDEAFDVVVSGFAKSFAKQAESEMFNEVGVSGEAQMKPEESREMQILKQKYKSN